MVDDVKPRAYRSTLRADQARDTRRRIREAADALFVERGYVATSMEDIAEAAGVSRQTVFTAFGSKSELLKEAFDVRLAGDDEPIPMADRPAGQRLLHTRDPVDAIRQMAKTWVDSTRRVIVLWPSIAAAAAADPAAAHLVLFYEQGRFEGPGSLVDVIADLGALRKGLSRRKAKEAMYLVTSPAVFISALELGWGDRDLQRWYVDCLSAVLLEPGAER